MSARDNSILLDVLADRLKESGEGISGNGVRINSLEQKQSSSDTRLTAVDARLKVLEKAVNGNGADGLKTSIALARSDINDIKEDKKASRMSIVALLALLVSIGSLAVNCAPGVIKAFSPSRSSSPTDKK